MPPRRALCALLLALTACSSARGGIIVPDHPNVVAYPVAKRVSVPSFDGENLRGGARITAAVLAGKPAVVNFWGSWCGPCRKEEPTLVQLAKTYGARGVVFLGVDERDQKAQGIAFQDEYGVTYPSIYDPSSALSSSFDLHYMPATYVIDRSGKIAGVVIGGITKPSDLTTLLDGVV
jgi:thiol-disulfide isomerase/thioredoxin